MADPIWRASELLHFSSSELELPLLSPFARRGDVVCAALNGEERTMLEPISRSGDVFSVSEEKWCITGRTGGLLDVFDRAPSANLFERLRSNEAFGGVGIGEDPFCSVEGTVMGAEKIGGGSSMDELVGVDSTCSGVFWNSASVPFSVSSLQRTPRLALVGDFFFIGENWTPFFTAVILLTPWRALQRR